MQGEIVSSILLPLVLAFIMYSLGLGLALSDFAAIARQPRAILVGVLCHFVLLPLVCFLMVKTAGVTGAFAVGFMILAACPTGSTSNLLTYLAGGDVALALSFTAVASILTIFTLPLIVAMSFVHFSSASLEVSVPIGRMMAQSFLLLGLPVGLGMLTQGWRPKAAQRLEPIFTKIATGLFVVIIALAIVKNWSLLRDNFTTLAPFAIALNLTMLLCGFTVAWLARLSRRQSVTLGIETAVQNAALALVIASTVLKNDAMAVPGAIYGVLMYAGGLLFSLVMRRFINETSSTARAHC
jgi:BASS family bile acid:Na+ symporter